MEFPFLLLAFTVLGMVPLGVYCVLQHPRRPFVIAYVLGAGLGGLALFLLVAGALAGVSDPSPLVFVVIGPMVGMVAGAWLAVTIAVFVVGPPPRRRGALWGAAAGAACAPLTRAEAGPLRAVLADLFGAAPEPLLRALVITPLACLGAVVGAQVALSATWPRARSRRFAIALGAVIIVLGYGAWYGHVRLRVQYLNRVSRVGDADLLTPSLRAGGTTERRCAAALLSNMPLGEQEHAVGPLVLAAHRDPDPEVRRLAAQTLARFGDYHVQEAFAAALQDSSPQVRLEAALALAEAPQIEAFAPLHGLLSSSDPELRDAAHQALRRRGYGGPAPSSSGRPYPPPPR